jgi:hypothetical protein
MCAERLVFPHLPAKVMAENVTPVYSICGVVLLKVLRAFLTARETSHQQDRDPKATRSVGEADP